jgi:hypothetical protein
MPAAARLWVRPGLTRNLAPAQHGAGADQRVGQLAGDLLDHGERVRRAERDFEGIQPALDQRGGERNGIFHPLDGQDRNDRRMIERLGHAKASLFR